MQLDFSSPQEQSQYESYLSQIQSGFANYGMTDPMATGAPKVSPSGSVWDWFKNNKTLDAMDSALWQGLLTPFGATPGTGEAITATTKGIANVGSFLTDIPRLLITITGFALVIFGLMAAANMSSPIQVIIPGKK